MPVCETLIAAVPKSVFTHIKEFFRGCLKVTAMRKS